MKLTLIIGLLSLLQCSTKSKTTENELLKKIENHKLITKFEMEELLHYNFEQYDENFIGTGNILSTGKIVAGIVQGIKNDTIFDIVIVYNNNKLIFVRENANASIYRKGKTIHREFILGQIYTTFIDSDTTCIKIYFETIQPFKVDTLNYKFRYDMGTLLNKDSLEFCSDSN
jgi:hypothetical protein